MEKNVKDELIYLSQGDIDKTGIGIAEAIECIKTTFSLYEKGEVNQPSKVVLDLDERKHGRINGLPAYVGGDVQMCGIKWIAGFPNNPARYGLSRANGLIILNSYKTGMPLAIIEGTRISALRTGAATAVAALYLANPNSRKVALIGAGIQSKTQLDAIANVLKGLKEVSVFDTVKKNAENFANSQKPIYRGIAFTAADTPEDCVNDADVVITATVADEPIVKEKWLKKGVFFAHIGTYQEEEEEVILKADKIVADIFKEVLHRGASLLTKMVNEGRIDSSRIHANLGQIVNGDKPGREKSDERIYFVSCGFGGQDVALAAMIYNAAFKAGLGIRLPFGESGG